jgi:hypothetical protein
MALFVFTQKVRTCSGHFPLLLMLSIPFGSSTAGFRIKKKTYQRVKPPK